MSDEYDWAKDDAYMQEMFDREQRTMNVQNDPAYAAYQEAQFQEGFRIWREGQSDNPYADTSEEAYVDWLLDSVDEP